MKKGIFSSVRRIILSVLVVAAFVMVIPFHRYLSARVDSAAEILKTVLEENLGLEITYDSLSPSILSTIVMRGITVSAKKSKTENNDAADKNQPYFVRIEKTKVNFKLSELLKGDISAGVPSILIDGIDIDIYELVDFIQYISNKMTDVQTSTENQAQTDQHFNFKEIKSYIPENVKLKNLNFTYKNESLDAFAYMKEISFANNSSNCMNVDLNASAGCNIYGIKESITCSVNVSGTIFDNLDNSNLALKIQNLTDGDFLLKQIAVLAKLDVSDNDTRHKISVQTIQSLNPVTISAEYDLENQLLHARLRTEEFSPVRIVSSKQKHDELSPFKKFLIDTDTEADFNVATQSFDYKSEGSVTIPDDFFPDGVKVDYNLEGNQNEIDIHKLVLQGPSCQANGDLSLIFKNLQASGTVNIEQFKLYNGTELSAEIFLDPLDSGFMAFAPQIIAGDRSLTAVQFNFMPQKDSYDFFLEGYDYSHFDYDSHGIIRLDGSYLTKSNYLQASVSLTELFVDSVVALARQFVPEEVNVSLAGVQSMTEPFLVSADGYISTNFETFSFNLPYIMAVNSQQANQAFMISAGGTQQSISLNQLNFVFGNNSLTASGSVDINPDTNDIFYLADLNFESVPYHLSGSVIKNVVSFSGDYSTLGEIVLGEKISGFAGFENLPLNIDLGSSVQSLVLSLASEFSYDADNGPEISFSHLEVEDLSTDILPNPKISTKGIINKYGAQLSSLTYRDDYYLFEGDGDFVLNLDEDILDSASLKIKLSDPLASQSIILDGGISNPDRKNFADSDILDSLYLNAEVDVQNFSLNRFAGNSNKGNILNATAYATGTIAHPFVSLNLKKAAILMGTSFMEMNGNAVLEDRDIAVNELNLSFAGMTLGETSLKFSLDKMEGLGTTLFSAGSEDKNIKVPLDISVSNIVTSKNGLESMAVSVASNNINGSLLRKNLDFMLMAVYSNNSMAFYSSKNLGLSGYFDTQKGKLKAEVDNGSSVKGLVDCVFDNLNTSVSLKNLYVDLAEVMSVVDFDELFKIRSGIITGNFGMKGNMTDPDFEGSLKLKNAIVNVPVAFANDIVCDELEITGNENEIHLQEGKLKLEGKDKLLLAADMIFNNGAVNDINASLKTVRRERIPLKLNTDLFELDGDFSTDIDAQISLGENEMVLTGSINGENVELSSGIFSITRGVSSSNSSQKSENKTAAVDNPMKVSLDLTVSLGAHSSLNFDPFLRCVFVPNTKVTLRMDSSSNVFTIDGLLGIKSGDISYLNRNFYIKEGSIAFNPSNIVNSRVTLSAEARERDDKGQNIKLMLRAEDQLLSNFNPKITSDPPKSEKELRTIMGQLVTGDMDTENPVNILYSAGDYAVQSLFFRQAENKLRDLLNFDIFSLRTNVIQNSLTQSINNPNQQLTFSNLMDNSTVYIGKYLGNSIYFDAVFQATFEEGTNFELRAPSGLLLPLELGLEIEAPFGNIRWNISQDLYNLFSEGAFLPTASVSLSWKWRF